MIETKETITVEAPQREVCPDCKAVWAHTAECHHACRKRIAELEKEISELKSNAR